MNRNISKTASLYLLSLLLLTALPAGASQSEIQSETESIYTQEECIECHRSGSEDSSLHISVKEYKASAHGQEVTCMECHTKVLDEEHESEEGTGAVTCRECHPVESGKVSFWVRFSSFSVDSHNKGDFGNMYEKDNCLGCHQGAGAHGEEEPINELQCHKCHLEPDAKGAMWGDMHPNTDKKPAMMVSATLYLFLFAGMFIIALRKSLDFIFDTIPAWIKTKVKVQPQRLKGSKKV
ncbi:cytochrome c3 family protein [Desulfococcaceae bacterium HSG7]|nr:cytochrome c3 family protein [Desulfococcaceae bacterium HSG7]